MGIRAIEAAPRVYVTPRTDTLGKQSTLPTKHDYAAVVRLNSQNNVAKDKPSDQFLVQLQVTADGYLAPVVKVEGCGWSTSEDAPGPGFALTGHHDDDDDDERPSGYQEISANAEPAYEATKPKHGYAEPFALQPSHTVENSYAQPMAINVHTDANGYLSPQTLNLSYVNATNTAEHPYAEVAPDAPTRTAAIPDTHYLWIGAHGSDSTTDDARPYVMPIARTDVAPYSQPGAALSADGYEQPGGLAGGYEYAMPKAAAEIAPYATCAGVTKREYAQLLSTDSNTDGGPSRSVYSQPEGREPSTDMNRGYALPRDGDPARNETVLEMYSVVNKPAYVTRSKMAPPSNATYAPMPVFDFEEPSAVDILLSSMAHFEGGEPAVVPRRASISLRPMTAEAEVEESSTDAPVND